jgi:clan AA aspartic protease
MITGHVNEFLELVIPISIRGPSGLERQIAFIIDTGFSAALTLPSQVIQELQLARGLSGRSMLADGTISNHQNYNAEIFWNDQWRSVVVMELGNEALIGTSLLAGHELQASFINSGPVKISPL